MSIFTGTLPFGIKAENILQLFTFGRGGHIAWLDNDGFVNIMCNAYYNQTRTNYKFNMYDLPDSYCTEFTYKEDTGTFLLKNYYGVVFEYHVHLNSNAILNDRPTSLGFVAVNVIKVIGGKMLIHENDKYVLDGSGGVLPTNNNGVLDLILDGSNGNVIEIKADDESANIYKVFGEYTITKDYKLLHNGTQIASEITSIGRFKQIKGRYLTIGRDDIMPTLADRAHYFFSSHGVESSWLDAYDSFIASAEKPSCSWSGYHETNTTTGSVGLCTATVPSPNIGRGSAILVIGDNGKLFEVVGDTLVEQIQLFPNDEAFNKIYKDGLDGKFLSFKQMNGSEVIETFDLEESETGESSYFLFRH